MAAVLEPARRSPSHGCSSEGKGCTDTAREREQTQISGFEVALAYLLLPILLLGTAWVAIDILLKVAH